MKKLFPVIYVFLYLIAAQSFAGSATWNLNPISSDWNTAGNWTPNTVPNSETDIATFGTSALTQVSLTDTHVDLASMIFSPGANEFIITGANGSFGFYGDGVVNNSGEIQQFVLDSDIGITFNNSASAGDATISYSISGFAGMSFFDTSSAGAANFTVADSSLSTSILFYGSSNGNATAANATFNILTGATVHFDLGSTPAFGTFIVDGGTLNFTYLRGAKKSTIVCKNGGTVLFYITEGDNSAISCNQGGRVTFESTSAGNAQITADGGTTSDNDSAVIDLKNASGDSAFFQLEGGVGARTSGAKLIMHGDSSADNAQVIINGGSFGGQGGSIHFLDQSDGGNATFTMSGNATLNMNQLDPTSFFTVGSLAGEGTVFLGASHLSVGSNNLSTIFSGVIENTSYPPIGSLSKVGTGILTISGANTYTGATTVSAGVLKASNATGSATGTGLVQVNSGTLGGGGIIAGPVIVGFGNGSGAFLAPAVAASQPKSLTVQSSLKFRADGTYTCKLNTNKATADQVIANGVTIESGAQFNFKTVANMKLTAGTVFTAVSNTAAAPISGTFANLADGSTFTAGRNKYQVSYSGGDGNDLTLTVLP
jgi:autotransporter-associated beta strand protein